MENSAAKMYLTDTERAERRQSLDQLESEITKLAGHLNAANHRFLMLIAEFDRREGWSDNATQSCAHWLNWKCGIDIGAAREKVRTARALEKLPKISAAMARGELSFAKVRALTRVACPDTEDYLLSIAIHGTAHHVEKLVQSFRRAADAAELSREKQQQANRYFSYRYDDDGSLCFKGCVPAEVGALLMKALEVAMNELPKSAATVDVSAETPTVKSQIQVKRADALALMAESFLENGPAALHGGDRSLVTVHVSAETLRHKEAGCCEIEDGPSMAAETARRLACDASVVAVIEDEDGEPLNVGRKTRTISSPLRRFLNARDKGCRFPGCTNTRYVDAHHIKHWAEGGETKPSNLVTLCRHHHRFVHEGGCHVHVLNDGAIRFTKSDGSVLNSIAPHHTHAFDWSDLPHEHERRDIHINERTAVTSWTGESMDYGLAVQVLLQRRERAARRGAAS